MRAHGCGLTGKMTGGRPKIRLGPSAITLNSISVMALAVAALARAVWGAQGPRRRAGFTAHLQETHVALRSDFTSTGTSLLQVKGILSLKSRYIDTAAIADRVLQTG